MITTRASSRSMGERRPRRTFVIGWVPVGYGRATRWCSDDHLRKTPSEAPARTCASSNASRAWPTSHPLQVRSRTRRVDAAVTGEMPMRRPGSLSHACHEGHSALQHARRRPASEKQAGGALASEYGGSCFLDLPGNGSDRNRFYSREGAAVMSAGLALAAMMGGGGGGGGCAQTPAYRAPRGQT